MTSIESPGTGAPTSARSDRSAPLRSLLLACGIASSLLYVATDVAGGLRYPGYSFWSQTISELAAFGAPTKPFVDPLFVAYDWLALAFAVGVLWHGLDRGRALRYAGALLTVRAVVGLSAPASLAMHQRAASTGSTDLPHVLLMAVIVLLLLAALAVGGFALGPRFRRYSFATIVAVVALSAALSPLAVRLSQGRSTPGLGLLERLELYAFMLWIAVFSVALLRQVAHERRDAIVAGSPPLARSSGAV